MAVTPLFLDSSFAIALSSTTDDYHARAKILAERILADKVALITTRAVMLEIGNALAKQRYRKGAIALLQSLEQDPRVQIAPLSQELYDQAFQLYRERQDKEWGITDCVSFQVMRERGILQALTADAHFQQAGYEALLLTVAG
jgi:predicted nucleic acid-binding protein